MSPLPPAEPSTTPDASSAPTSGPVLPPARLESLLKNLDQYGRLIKDRPFRQVWRFEHQGRAYYLKFYPRDGSRLKRWVRGNPAMREFVRLQRLQKGNVPACRVVNVLIGFTLAGQRGDAVILDAIEPSIPLDRYLNDLKLAGEPIPNHRHLVDQVCQIIQRLGEARLGHADLHFGNMLLKDGQVFLLDAQAVRLNGLSLSDLMLLAHSAQRFATRSDLLRGWNVFASADYLPKQNTVSRRQWRKLLERSWGDNKEFGRLQIGDWHGHFFKSTRFPRRWSAASQMTFDGDFWRREWPRLFERMGSGELEALKQSRSGDVVAADISVGAATLPIVIKRPYKRYWYRYINEIGRGSRSHRAWGKAWRLVARSIPTAWPLLLLERRTLGYVTDSVILFERIEGPMLSDVDLDALSARGRDMLFRRVGRILRKIESFGYAHFDAKASNWIVAGDEKLGPRPVLIDVDGVRFRRWVALGIRRLLRSMLEHPQYTPADSLALCQGYAPYSPGKVRRETPPAPPADPAPPEIPA